jgi:hypothetical protein
MERKRQPRLRLSSKEASMHLCLVQLKNLARCPEAISCYREAILQQGRKAYFDVASIFSQFKERFCTF